MFLIAREPDEKSVRIHMITSKLHTVHVVAGIQLESLLVAVDVKLDTGVRTGKLGNRTLLCPVIWSTSCSVDQVGVVVTSAVVTTSTVKSW